MNEDEILELRSTMRIAHDEIINLRRELEEMRPKAKAWDTIEQVVSMMPGPTQVYGVDITWQLKQAVDKLSIQLKLNKED